MNIRRLLSHSLLLAASTTFAIAAFEVAVHAIEAIRGPMFPGGPRTLNFTEGDRVLGWKHGANVTQQYGWPEHPSGSVTIRTNALGLREDGPTTREPAPDSFRVIAIGDSHTDGLVNNHESWPNVLENFAQHNSQPWEVLNGGVTGYQPWQYYLWWWTVGRSLEPDLVLLGYYLGNDLIEAGGPRLQRSANGSWQIDESSGPPMEADGWSMRAALTALRRLCRTCALASLVGHRLFLDGPTFEEAGYVRGSDERQRERYLAALRHCLGCVWQSLDQPWVFEGDSELYRHELSATRELLRRLEGEVERAGARLVVVVIPTKLQVEPDARARAREAASRLGLDDLEPLFEDRLETDLLALLTDLDVETVNVREALMEAHERLGEPIYYEGDWHLNVAGSRIVGMTVGRALLANDDGEEPSTSTEAPGR